MVQIKYTVPTAADLKAKEVKPSYVSHAHRLLERVAEVDWSHKWNGTGFVNTPWMRDNTK